MEFKILGLTLAMKMSIFKDTMHYYGSGIKTKNNEIIRGKWQKK
jgi:hypothetical protein